MLWAVQIRAFQQRGTAERTLHFPFKHAHDQRCGSGKNILIISDNCYCTTHEKMAFTMNAAILSIGDEVILGQSVDTNTAWLSSQLAEIAISPIEHRTVVDDRAAISLAVRDLAMRADCVILTGGLGPTDDDQTRDALCDVLTPDQQMVSDEQALRWLDEWFARHGRHMPPTNLRQVQRPATMRCLPNPHGTAPGLAGRFEQCLIYALPGPPTEMKPMFTEHVLPELLPQASNEVLLTQFVHAFGIGESEAGFRLGDLTARNRHPLIGTTVSDSILTARIRAHGAQEEVTKQVEEDAQRVEQRWWPYVYGRGEMTLQRAVGALLKQCKKTLTTVESCTGGLLGKMLVDVPGSSAYYLGGWVTYTNELKTTCMAVPGEMLKAYGAVSAEVAAAMASGGLANVDADYALAISGIAGPGGGTPEKPVGTVFIALAQLNDQRVSVASRRFVFFGDRMQVRDRSAKAALQILRFALLDLPEQPPLLWQVQPKAVSAKGTIS